MNGLIMFSATQTGGIKSTVRKTLYNLGQIKHGGNVGCSKVW